jgi:hypothetical protein
VSHQDASIAFVVRALHVEDHLLTTTLNSLFQLDDFLWSALILLNEMEDLDRISRITHDNPRIHCELYGYRESIGRLETDVLGFVEAGCRVDKATIKRVVDEISSGSRHLIIAPSFGIERENLRQPTLSIGGVFLSPRILPSVHSVTYSSTPLSSWVVPVPLQSQPGLEITEVETYTPIETILASLREKDAWCRAIDEDLIVAQSRIAALELEINRLASANLGLNQANDALNDANNRLFADNQDLLRLVDEHTRVPLRFARLRRILKRL